MNALARGAVALLYAHWEGFVKVASSAYVEHVRVQGRKLGELKSNFVVLSARKVTEQAWQSSRWRFQIELCEAVRSNASQQARWPKAWSVDTGSNLTVTVFRDIVAVVGIPYREEFQIAEKPIIERLLELRNGIAHGDSQNVDLTEFRQLDARVDDLLQLFCNDLDNAAATELYRIVPPAA